MKQKYKPRRYLNKRTPLIYECSYCKRRWTSLPFDAYDYVCSYSDKGKLILSITCCECANGKREGEYNGRT